MNTTELLAISSAIVPHRPAIVFEGRTMTYADLHARVDRLANALAELGLTAGDRVAMLQVNSPEHVEAYFAAAKLDAVYVPLNFRSRAGELRQVIDDARPRVLIVGRQYVDVARELMDGVESLERCVALEAPVAGWSFYDEMIASASDEERYPQADGGDPTVIMFTAGTTGPPKGVMLGHDSFSSYVLSNVAPADPEVDERNILTVPMYHVAGLQALMAGVYGGRTLVIQRQFEPNEWMSLVESERVDRAMVVPTMLKMLMDHQDFRKHDLSSLRVITYGAAPMPLELIRRAIEAFPGAQFVNAFGQTETASTITMLAPQDHVLEGTPDAVERKLRRLSSIGRPLEDVQVRIVDEDGADVVQGEVGEIVARGERLMSGYWGRWRGHGGDDTRRLAPHRRSCLLRRRRLHLPGGPGQGLHQAGRGDDIARRGRGYPSLPPGRRTRQPSSACRTYSGARVCAPSSCSGTGATQRRRRSSNTAESASPASRSPNRCCSPPPSPGTPWARSSSSSCGKSTPTPSTDDCPMGRG